MDEVSIDALIARWRGTGGAERANYSLFLTELCDALGVPRPDAATGGLGDYRFERAVTRHERDGSTSGRRIDLYKRDCFVLEAKQAHDARDQPNLFEGASSETERRSLIRRTRGWAQAMLKAKGQAEDYARDLPSDEGWPPFVIVCDVGFCFDLYADFSRTGKHYAQFPDREAYRIYLTDLRDPAIRDRLRAVWNNPMSLDPAKRRVEVTRDIAALLAKLAAALEGRGHPANAVATFLMRSVFSMFAQSVGLLPSRTAFTELLEDCRHNLPGFVPLVADMWRTMDKGGFSSGLRAVVKQFNGGLFAGGAHGPPEPLPVDADMLELLIIASRRDWSDVEPAIFGTLLENAITVRERGRLGAHFTPRAFVERLVAPTIMEPLLEEWNGVKAAAVRKVEAGDQNGATDTLRGFHARLCTIRVLDPACGTGNFLYVALDLMKRLEDEVLGLLADLSHGEGDPFDLTQATVDPHQFLGLELNPRAVPVAELVLWIGWLQWHFRTRAGRDLPEPILRDFRNIQHADALLDYREQVPVGDKTGRSMTRWGGRTKLHPITGEIVPDETDRILLMRPSGAKPTTWPDADFIVGNPPFIAGKDLRVELGDGYAEALWKAYPKVPKSADLALHFWWQAAQALLPHKQGKGGAVTPPARRFGFISSNSIRQVFCRRVVAEAIEGKPPIHLAFAIPDHPWADGTGAAAVRIAMTVAELGSGDGTLATLVYEEPGTDGVPLVSLATHRGRINPDLTIGADVKAARSLLANDRIAWDGVKLHGSGFIITSSQAAALGLGRVNGLAVHIRTYRNGRDIQQRSRNLKVIDLFGLDEHEVRRRFPAVYQHILLNVKPEREQNNRTSYKKYWWLFGEPRRELRSALKGIYRFIATVDTSKHRIFTFLPPDVIVDDKVVVVASDDAFHLGTLQSRHHVAWILAQGNWLGVGNDPVYAKTQCFDNFPFPTPSPALRAEIAAIAEELDAHRKARLATHPHLTLTSIYNVLAAIRLATPLTPAEKDIHDAGQVSILRGLHDRLDAAVASAYDWPDELTDSEIVARVVELNAQRVREEAEGIVRWLRPEFQAPEEERRQAQQFGLVVDMEQTTVEQRRWPLEEPAQFVALRAMLRQGPVAAIEVRRQFKGAPRGDKVPKMLETLVALGQARALHGGRYAA